MTASAPSAETSFDHTQFRQYTSQLARWLSPDPLGGSIANPQSLNRYAYVLDDPMDFTDPLGLFLCGSIWVNCYPPSGGGKGDLGGPGVLVSSFNGDGAPGGHECLKSTSIDPGTGTPSQSNCGPGGSGKPTMGPTPVPPPPTIGPDPDWFHSKQEMCAEKAAKATMGGLVMKKEIDAAGSFLLGGSADSTIPQAITPGSVAEGAHLGLNDAAANRPLITTIRTALSEQGWKVSGNAIARGAARAGHFALGVHAAFAAFDGYEAYAACMAD